MRMNENLMIFETRFGSFVDNLNLEIEWISQSHLNYLAKSYYAKFRAYQFYCTCPTSIKLYLI